MQNNISPNLETKKLVPNLMDKANYVTLMIQNSTCTSSLRSPPVALPDSPSSMSPIPPPMADQPIVWKVGDAAAELEDWEVNGLEEETDEEGDTDDDYGGPILASSVYLRRRQLCR